MDAKAARNGTTRVKVLVEGALCVALSVVFSYLKIFRMPQGGSITLEMAPLLFFAYRRGFKWGLSVGALSGLLQLLLGGFVAHPLQALLDYPLAFACMGIAGLFPEQQATGTMLAGLARLLCHVLAGAIFFAGYAPAGQNPWAYALVYNGTFMLPSLLLSGVAAWLLWKKLGDG